MNYRKLKIGTRGSQLALKQANMVKEEFIKIMNCPEDFIEIIVIKTAGDMFLDRNFNEIGTKGIFTKEIEDKLLSKEIDIAVHSMKDMASTLPEGLEVGAVMKREQPNDAFISKKVGRLTDLRKGMIVGTSSLRRTIQIKNMNPELKVVQFRGNVNSRLQKIDDNQVDATILALAGLKRLGINKHQYSIIAEDEMLPAATQGIVAIENRHDDIEIKKILDQFSDSASMIQAKTERSFLRQLEKEKQKSFPDAVYNNCQTPVAALSKIENDQVKLKAMIGNEKNFAIFYYTAEASTEDCEKLGIEAAKDLFYKVY